MTDFQDTALKQEPAAPASIDLMASPPDEASPATGTAAVPIEEPELLGSITEAAPEPEASALEAEPSPLPEVDAVPAQPAEAPAADTLAVSASPSPTKADASDMASPTAAQATDSTTGTPTQASGATPASTTPQSATTTPTKITSATPTPIKVAAVSPAAAGSSTPTPDPTPASPLPASNGTPESNAEEVTSSISIKDLKKQLSVSGSSTPTPKPITPSASSQQLSPRVSRPTKESVGPAIPRSEHDLVNNTNASEVLKLGNFKLQPLKDFIPYDELIKLRLEDGIDPARKEDYLTEEEFKKVMGMSREDFAKVPTWRKTNMKKDKSLW